MSNTPDMTTTTSYARRIVEYYRHTRSLHPLARAIECLHLARAAAVLDATSSYWGRVCYVETDLETVGGEAPIRMQRSVRVF